MATFRMVDDPTSNEPKTILEVFQRPDNVIVGRLFSSGPYGLLPLTGEEGNEFPILSSFDKAADHVGPKGVVYVNDPSKLWAPEWPDLS